MMALKCRVSNELSQLNFPMDSYAELIPLIDRLPKVSDPAASGTSPLPVTVSITDCKVSKTGCIICSRLFCRL